MNDLIDLRGIAKIARSSALHNLKVGLTPDEADSIADALEAQVERIAKLEAAINAELAMSGDDEYVDLRAALKGDSGVLDE